MTYSECIPLIKNLNHSDKLRLAQWLIKAIAQEEGVNDFGFDNVGKQSGLCGIPSMRGGLFNPLLTFSRTAEHY